MNPTRKLLIYVCVACFLVGGHLQLAVSFTWTQLPPDPTKVIRGSNASLTWEYYKEKLETLTYIEFRRMKDSGSSEGLGNIASDGAITVSVVINISLTATNRSAVLMIHGTKRAHQYCCKIKTSRRKEEKCIHLRVLVPPKLAAFPTDKTVNETGSLNLSCNATGIPAPNISWTKVGSDKQFSQKEYLVIEPVRKEDSGTYMCKASNEAGSVTAQAFVDIQYKPRGTKLFSSAAMDTVTANDSVTFNCSTDANPPPHVFRLYHEGSLIVQNASFAIDRVTWSDEGKYTCVPSNILGRGENASVALTISVPSQLHIIPRDQTVNESDTMVVFCNASGNPAPNITWTKVGTTGPPISTGNTMKIINVNHQENGGIYECSASNGIGKNVTARFKATVNYKAVMTRLQSNLTNDELLTGSSLILNCTTDAIPLPDFYSFYQAGKALQNTSGVLTIKQANVSHEGVYDCTPYNILGAGQTANLNITVLVPPQIVTQPQNTTVNETDALSLFCNATGRPTPKISWHKDGLPVGRSSNSQTLKIQNVTKKNAGVYTCLATSRVIQSDTAKAVVSVNYRPIIKHWSQTISSWINHTTELSCLLEGVPTPNISWSRSGQKSLETINQTHVVSNLTIIPNKPRDFGVYTCQAVNILGTQKQSMKLLQLTPPGKPVISVESGMNDIEVHWTPPADGGRPITNYTVQVKKTESGEWRDCKDIKQKGNKLSCSFTDVESGTRYVVRVVAVNEIGHSEPATKELGTVASGASSRSPNKKVKVEWTIIVVASSLGGIVLLVLFGVIFHCKHKKSIKERRSRREDGIFGNWVDLPHVPCEANVYSGYQNQTMADVEMTTNSRYQEPPFNKSRKGNQIMVNTFPQTMPPYF